MKRPIGVTRRQFLAGSLLASSLQVAGSRKPWAQERKAGPLEGLGELLICGFSGKDADSATARWLARQIREGKVAGAVFVKENVGSLEQVRSLTKLFSDGAPSTPILAIDHEGGAVQRLDARHGFARLPSAKKVAATMTPDEAEVLYARDGAKMAALGFNLNLAPDVDLDNPANPAIGHFGRAFSADPTIVAAYGKAFVDGFRKAGVACTLKHFPGQGSALEDSHFELPDLQGKWSELDLEPFRLLIEQGRASSVMTGFSVHGIGPKPHKAAALSRTIVTGLLRGELGFDGVAMTDDLDMGGIGGGQDRESVALQALQAGNDLLMIRNAAHHDPDLPAKFARWAEKGVSSGLLSAMGLQRSIERVRAFRNTELG